MQILWNPEVKNFRIEANLINLKKRLFEVKKRKMTIKAPKKIKLKINKGKDQNDMKLIRSILNKNRQGSLPSLVQNKSENLLTNIIANWNSTENLKYGKTNFNSNTMGLGDKLKIDQDRCIENIRQRHFSNALNKIDRSLHYKDMQKNYEYKMFAYRQQVILEDEISKEYKSGIMDPCRVVAMFERTKSSYKILAGSLKKKKLQLNAKKGVGKYQFSSEID